jgi:predicted RNase H-like nuclease (RuvC/YqgF family)
MENDLQKELNRLVEIEKADYEKSMIIDNDKEDDFQASFDMDAFEKKMMRRGGGGGDSDDDDVFTKKTKGKQPMGTSKGMISAITNTKKPITTTTSMSKAVPTKTDVSKPKPQPKYDMQDMIPSKGGDSLKDKKISDLNQQNKDLMAALERERAIRTKLEQDLQSKGGKSTTTTTAQSSSAGLKGSDKKEDTNSLKTQIKDLASENEVLQGKVKTAGSTKAALEKKIEEIKVEYEKNKKILVEKSENDDKYIALLKQEIDKLKKPSTLKK